MLANTADLGFGSVATLCTQDDYASHAIHSFEEEAKAIGITVRTSAEFSFGGSFEEACTISPLSILNMSHKIFNTRNLNTKSLTITT